MVNFKLGNEMRNDEIINMTRAWDKEKVPDGNLSNPWPPEHRAGALSTELREWRFSLVCKLVNYSFCCCYSNVLSSLRLLYLVRH